MSVACPWERRDDTRAAVACVGAGGLRTAWAAAQA